MAPYAYATPCNRVSTMGNNKWCENGETIKMRWVLYSYFCDIVLEAWMQRCMVNKLSAKKNNKKVKREDDCIRRTFINMKGGWRRLQSAIVFCSQRKSFSVLMRSTNGERRSRVHISDTGHECILGSDFMFAVVRFSFSPFRKDVWSV